MRIWLPYSPRLTAWRRQFMLDIIEGLLANGYLVMPEEIAQKPVSWRRRQKRRPPAGIHAIIVDEIDLDLLDADRVEGAGLATLFFNHNNEPVHLSQNQVRVFTGFTKNFADTSLLESYPVPLAYHDNMSQVEVNHRRLDTQEFLIIGNMSERPSQQSQDLILEGAVQDWVVRELTIVDGPDGPDLSITNSLSGDGAVPKAPWQAIADAAAVLLAHDIETMNSSRLLITCAIQGIPIVSESGIKNFLLTAGGTPPIKIPAKGQSLIGAALELCETESAWNQASLGTHAFGRQFERTPYAARIGQQLMDLVEKIEKKHGIAV